MKEFSRFAAKVFATSIVALGVCSQANAFINGEIVRISNNSDALQSFANTADLVSGSDPILNTTSPSTSYENDGWFYLDNTIYRTTGIGSIYSYDSEADFLADTGNSLGTYASYAEDEFFTYDFDGQEKIVRVSDGDNITIYDTVALFISGSGTSVNGDFSSRTDLGDDGYYSWQGAIFRIGNGAGDIIKYDDWDAFTSRTGTIIGTVGNYANDGFFVVPEPTSFAVIFGAVALSFTVSRRRMVVRG